jgi:hypothetical protein
MNDERPIEKLLRRYAKKRRDETGAPAELHPANRRALQAEVARQFPKAQRRTGWWAGVSLLLNRKLAYAMAIVAVVGLAGLLLRPSKREPMGLAALDAPKAEEKEFKRKVADKEISSVEMTARENKDSYAPTGAGATPAVRTESLSLAADTGSAARELNSAPPQPAPPSMSPASQPRPSPTSNVEGDRTVMRQQQAADSMASFTDQSEGREAVRSDAPPAEPPRAPIASDSAKLATATGTVQTRGSGFGGGGGGFDGQATPAAAQMPADGNQTRFRQVATVTAPVLVNFVVEQTGDQIRVTDSDGSTYAGKMQLVEAEVGSTRAASPGAGGRGGGAPASTMAAGGARRTQPEGEPQYQFQFVGTNRTLNQPVNVVGNLVALTNPLSGPTATAQFAEQAKKFEGQSLPRLENSALQGRLRIGTGREIELNATPVPR